jgi:PAS domain S-box-containing protein
MQFHNPAVILTNNERKIVWVNRFFSKMTGYFLDEAAGKRPSFLQGPLTEEDKRQFIRQKLEALVPFKASITNYKKSGEEYVCEINVFPVFNSKSQVKYFISFEYELNNQIDKRIDRYPKSSLKGKKEIDLFIELITLIQKTQIFLNPDLSLKEVAERLNSNTKYISQIINKFAGVGFFEFINEIRVQRFKESMKSGVYRNLTIYGLAQQCGFKNKSTFFRVFKSMNGKTPSAYYS